mgnify:CR=1 FL=1
MNKIKINRLGEEKMNNQNILMKIINYNNANDIIVEFQDEYKGNVHTSYTNFSKGLVKNPYSPSVCGVGINGTKYPMCIDGVPIKEYRIWIHMIERCFGKKRKKSNHTYQNVICCDEWLLYENFYEWLHRQENFNKWLNNENWDIDKDILIKGNKIYSPDTCVLVPHNVNCLFLKCKKSRNTLPIGVEEVKGKFYSYCNNPFDNEIKKHLGIFETKTKAFYAYKNYKENLIKQVANNEYQKGNITQKCYQAMIDYKVEITD